MDDLDEEPSFTPQACGSGPSGKLAGTLWVGGEEVIRRARPKIEMSDERRQALKGVAFLLMQPIRKALNDHFDGHDCGETGFFYCPEAKRLWDLLPDGDRIVLAI